MRKPAILLLVFLGCLAVGTARAQRSQPGEAELLRAEVARLSEAVSRLERVITRMAGQGSMIYAPIDEDGWRNAGNRAVLSPGMSKLEVRALLGSPLSVTNSYGSGLTQWSYPNGSSVHFSQATGQIPAPR